jgi:hypothetical protein
LARRLKVSRQHLKILSFNQAQWPDICLGLNQPGEFCLLVVTNGWRVEVNNGRKSWFYRTDETGQNIRLESTSGTISLPSEVGDRLLQLSAEDLGIPRTQLRIAQSESQITLCDNPTNSTNPTNPENSEDPAPANSANLDNANPAAPCSELAGWRVIVVKAIAEVHQGCWIYHVDETGKDIEMDQVASQGTEAALIPTFLTTSEQMRPLGSSVVFRTIASGGFSNQTYETILRQDGQLWRSLSVPSASISQSQLRQISPEQVQQFQALLTEANFARFNRLSYSPRPNPDSISVTLTSQDGTTQYISGVENQLPGALREVLGAWDAIVSS